jgi:hypothetical protein
MGEPDQCRRWKRRRRKRRGSESRSWYESERPIEIERHNKYMGEVGELGFEW